METKEYLARLGAVAAFGGAALFLVSTLLHPMDSDPNNAPAAFAEYALDSLWVWSHLGQFFAIVLLGSALVALAATVEPGRPAAWARVGMTGIAVTIGAAAALQAVDGVALKIMVDRWAAAGGEARALAFEAAFGVRQIEIGLASFLSLVFGLTAATFSMAMLQSTRYPNWLGAIGLLGALATMASGAAQASTGFSKLSMTSSMLASSLLLAWFVLGGIFMWRLAPRLNPPHKARNPMAASGR